MTKDSYFEMCELLGSEPIEEEIPVELDDFPDLVQQCFYIYSMLADTWDPMGGNYLGKNYQIVFELLHLYKIEDAEALLTLEFLNDMDQIRGEIIGEKIRQKTPATK